MNTTIALLLPLLLAPPAVWTQSLLDCRVIYVEPMPEAMDGFASAKLIQWGKVQIIKDAGKADCTLSFPRQRSKINLHSTGSRTVPKTAEVTATPAGERLPVGHWGYRQAAFELVHRESCLVVWATSATDASSWGGGPKGVAEKLIGRLKKDYEREARKPKHATQGPFR
jgi:hypothetical protein